MKWMSAGGPVWPVIATLLVICFAPAASLAYELPPALPPLQRITPDNAGQIQQLAVLGRGVMKSVQWSPDGDIVAVITDSATWLYPAADLQAEPRLIPTRGPVAFSPDWSTAVSGSGESRIQIWDVQTGQRRETWPWETFNRPSRFVFTADGQRLVSASYDEIRVWDVQTGTTVNLEGLDRSFIVFTVSRDSRWLAATFTGDWTEDGYRAYITLVNLETGASRTLDGPGEVIYALDFSADSRQLLAAELGTQQGELRVWDVETGAQVESLGSGVTFAENLRFSPDGNTFAVGHGPLQIRDAVTFDLIDSMDSWAGGNGFGNQVAFSPDGMLVAANGGSCDVVLYSLKNQSAAWRQRAGGCAPLGLAFSPDNARLAVIGADNRLRLLDAASGAVIASVQHDRFAEPVFLNDHLLMADNVFHPAAPSPEDNIVSVLWDLSVGSHQDYDFGDSVLVRDVLYSPAAETFVIITYSNAGVVLWDQNTMTPRQELEGNYAALSPDGRILALANYTTLRLIDLPGGDVLRVVSLESPVFQLGFNPAGSRLYVGVGNASEGIDPYQVRIYDVQTGTLRHVLHYEEGIDGFSVSPNENFVAVQSLFSQQSLIITYVPTRGNIGVNQGYISSGVVFAPRGTRLAFSDEGGSILVWDDATREVTTQYQSGFHDYNWITEMTFIPHTSILAYYDQRGSVINLLDIDTGERLASLREIFTNDASIAASPDGRLLVIRVDDGTLQVWGVPAVE